MPRFNLDAYVSVQERINSFWHDHPDGQIITTIQSPSDDFTKCRYVAEVYRHKDDARPSATGWAFEIAGGQGANQTSHEENCETSAIGRALANLGYATSHAQRPSREEMTKANQGDRVQTFPQPARDVRPHEPAPPAAARQHGSGAERTTPLTPPQLGKIKAMASDLGWDRDAGRQVIQARYGKASTSELTVGEASDLITYMEQQMPADSRQPALSAN